MELKPKEKAEELVGKMHNNLYSDGLYDALKCAELCVNETLNALENIPYIMVSGNILLDQIKYYKKVRECLINYFDS